jgi:hypothetical protein
MKRNPKGQRRNTSALPPLTPSYEKPCTEDNVAQWHAFAEEQMRMQKHLQSLTQQLHDLRKKYHAVAKQLRFERNAPKMKVSAR